MNTDYKNYTIGLRLTYTVDLELDIQATSEEDAYKQAQTIAENYTLDKVDTDYCPEAPEHYEITDVY